MGETGRTAASPGPLKDLRVLDLSGHPGQYCGKMFSDLGADVILVEPPGGSALRRLGPFVDDEPDVEAGLLFAYMNTGKRGVTLDLDHHAGRDALLHLARSADLVIESERPGIMAARGLGYSRLAEVNPRLVCASITPFGQTGPWAHYEADDLVAMALGGMLYLGGYADGAPVVAYGYQAYGAASVFAAVASLACVLAAEATGRGEHIDVSIQECVVLGMENAAQFFDLEGTVRRRFAGEQRQAGAGVFPASDGLIYMLAGGVGGNRFWVNTVRWLNEACVEGAAELLDPRWQDNDFLRTDRAKRRFNEIFRPFTASRTMQELYDLSKIYRVPLAPVSTPADLLRNRQLGHRDFFTSVWNPFAGRQVIMPGAPYRFSSTPWRIGRPAPALGEHNEEILGSSGFPRWRRDQLQLEGGV